jgi:hypothetical protein
MLALIYKILGRQQHEEVAQLGRIPNVVEGYESTKCVITRIISLTSLKKEDKK